MAYFARVGPGRGAVTAACGTLRGRPDPAAAGEARARAPQVLPDQINRLYIQTFPFESSDDVRPPAAAGPAGPAAVVVGLAAPVELVTDEEASQTWPTPVVVAARVAAADKPAVGDPVPLDDGFSYLVHIKQIEERE